MPYSYSVSAHSSAPPERVFALLDDALSWTRWAKPTIGHAEWERQGDPPPGGVGAIRKLGRWPMYGREEIVEREPPSHHAYTMLSGNPVRNYRADIALVSDDRGGTNITWLGTFDPLVPGTGRVLVAIYGRLIGGFARKVAAYAEKSS